jgi:peptidoglycan/xylan/chitin deacetylase (PgdA/CDA1 family)
MTAPMRASAILVAAIVALVSYSHSRAEVAATAVDACSGRKDVLGVSRIVEIDTTSAPKFGAQYQDATFLEDGEVVLTFDDGPLRHYSQRVLDALDGQCAKATFFIVGRMAVADPDMLKEMAQRGHTIGIHTWSHKKQSVISAAKAKEEIELGLSATAKALGGTVAPFFRFPYLRDTKAMLSHLSERQIGTFGIDVDSRDFTTRNPGSVQRAVLQQLATKRKGIILFHDIQPSTAGALRSLLAELKARGFKIVHMVPKTAATTLPEYDTLADEELARKMVAAAKSPLATRAVVWPSGTDKAKAAKPAATEPEVLPWLKGTDVEASTPPPVAPVRPPRRPEPPGLADDPWQLRTMGQ